jgi:hypothetical protein
MGLQLQPTAVREKWLGDWSLDSDRRHLSLITRCGDDGLTFHSFWDTMCQQFWDTERGVSPWIWRPTA